MLEQTVQQLPERRAAEIRKIVPGDGQRLQADAVAGGYDFIYCVRLRQRSKQPCRFLALGGEQPLPAEAFLRRGPVGARHPAELDEFGRQAEGREIQFRNKQAESGPAGLRRRREHGQLREVI